MATQALEQFSFLESSRKLSVLQLANTIGGADDQSNATTRTSDASIVDDVTTTPASLAADLVHYKELFSKLHFSYIEQVTKEKFLRAITAESPLFVEPEDNAALDKELLREKEALKAQKEEVACLLAELEAKSRAIANRYAVLQSQTQTLSTLPDRISELESAIASLRSAYPSPSKSTPSHLTLPLPATLSLLESKRSELHQIESQISSLKNEEVPRSQQDFSRIEAELQVLGNQKKAAVVRAREAKTRKENGGVDEAERRGRWVKAGEKVLRDVVEIEA